MIQEINSRRILENSQTHKRKPFPLESLLATHLMRSVTWLPLDKSTHWRSEVYNIGIIIHPFLGYRRGMLCILMASFKERNCGPAPITIAIGKNVARARDSRKNDR